MAGVRGYLSGDGGTDETGALAAAASWADGLDFRFSNGSVGKGALPAPPAATGGFAFTEAEIYPGVVGKLIEAPGDWNSVKNVESGPDAWSPAWDPYLAVVNFVDVRLDFSNAPAGPDPGNPTGLDITIVGAKRGTLDLGAGDDYAFLYLHSNEASWNNRFTIDAGEGRNDIQIGTVANAPFLAPDLLPGPDNGPLWNANYDGRFSTVEVFGGSDFDSIFASGAMRLVAHGGGGGDRLQGGAGNDLLDPGADTDTVIGGAGDDVIILRAGETQYDIIEDFQGAGTQGGDVIQLVGFGEDVTLVAGGDQMGNRVYFLMGPAEEDFRGAFYAAPGLVPGEDIVFVA